MAMMWRNIYIQSQYHYKMGKRSLESKIHLVFVGMGGKGWLKVKIKEGFKQF